MECLAYYRLSLYVISLNFPERGSNRRFIYSHFTAVKTEALRRSLSWEELEQEASLGCSSLCCASCSQQGVWGLPRMRLWLSNAMAGGGGETGAYRDWHFQGETRIMHAQPCEERWAGASEQLSWSWARKEGDREPQMSGESTPSRGQSGEVKETRPASLRLTPSPVLSSAYRRSVLAPSPDTDSECAVSQATVVMTEI